jgi:uncharacterized metal-binding protein
VGSLVGIFVTPDLDLSNAGIVQGALIRKRVGWFGERAWKWFWKGYSESCKHGQFMSHFPIFSTIVRLLYVYFWLIFLPDILILRLFVPNLNLIGDLVWWGTIIFEPGILLGLIASDTVHFGLDKLTTAHTGEQ